jgi:hypothetical protein
MPSLCSMRASLCPAQLALTYILMHLQCDTCHPSQRAKAAGIPYKDMQLPMLIRAVYGSRPPRLITMVRDPVERLYVNYLA